METRRSRGTPSSSSCSGRPSGARRSTGCSTASLGAVTRSSQQKSPKHPVFARIYDPLLARPAERWEGRYRSELCGGAEGLVLEIGAGTGMNFSHYSTVSGVVAIEPEPRMLAQAKRRGESDPAPIVLVR